MKIVSIKKNYEFRRLYARGDRAGTPRMVIYCRHNRLGINRLGITVSTKLGKAIHRNLIRRRLREIFRLNSNRLAPGWDIVVVAKLKSRFSSYSELEGDFIRACDKLGIWLVNADETDPDICH